MHASVVLNGQLYVALLHSTGVDIVTCTGIDERHEVVQSLRAPLATRACFCQRTGVLAVLEESALRIFGCSLFSSLTLSWSEVKTVLIPLRCLSGGSIISHSFSYPLYQIHIKGIMTICHVELLRFENVNNVANIPNLVTGGSLSHLSGFMATLERETSGALLLRVTDVSVVFDDAVADAAMQCATVEVSPECSKEVCVHQHYQVAWRPTADADCEILLTCANGSVKIWTVVHGKEHEVVTAALHAAAAAGIRAERSGSLHAATPPEICLVADLSPICAGLSLLTSSIHESHPHLMWMHQSLMTTTQGRETACWQSSDLWLVAVLSPAEHPLAPIWVYQLLHLRPKGRYHQYDACLAGEPIAVKSPLDCNTAVSPLSQKSLRNSSKFICASVLGRFSESASDQPAMIHLVSHFQPSDFGRKQHCQDMLTLGMSLGLVVGNAIQKPLVQQLQLKNSFVLLHHAAPVSRAVVPTSSFVPLSVSEDLPRLSGIPKSIALPAGSTGQGTMSSSKVRILLANAKLSAALASFATALPGFLNHGPLALRIPLSHLPLLVPKGSNSSPSLCPTIDESSRVLRVVAFEPMAASGSGSQTSSLGSWLAVLTVSSSLRLTLALFCADPNKASPSPPASFSAVSVSPFSARSHSEDGNSSTMSSRGLRVSSTDIASAAAAQSLSNQGAQYSVEVVPDKQFGLGLRLGSRDGYVSVDSFKRSDDNQPLAAERSGIEAGDELLAVNGMPLADLPLNEVIDIVRSVLAANPASTALTLTLRQPDKELFPGAVPLRVSSSKNPNKNSTGTNRQNSPSGTTRNSSGSPRQAISAIESARLFLDCSWEWQMVTSYPLDAQCLAADLVLTEDGADLLLSQIDGRYVVLSRVSLVAQDGDVLMGSEQAHAGLETRQERQEQWKVQLTELGRCACPLPSVPVPVTLQMWLPEVIPANLNFDPYFVITVLCPPIPQKESTPVRRSFNTANSSSPTTVSCSWSLQTLRVTAQDGGWSLSEPKKIVVLGRTREDLCAQPWALLSCPLLNPFDGGTLLMHVIKGGELSVFCGVIELHFAQIQGNFRQLETLEASTEAKNATTARSGVGRDQSSSYARATLSQVLLLQTRSFESRPEPHVQAAPESLAPWLLSLGVPVLDSLHCWPSGMCEPVVSVSPHFLAQVSGVRFCGKDSLVIFGESGSLSLRRVCPALASCSTELWLPSSQTSLFAGEPARLSMAGHDALGAAAGEGLACPLFSSTLTHSQACDPVRFLQKLFLHKLSSELVSVSSPSPSPTPSPTASQQSASILSQIDALCGLLESFASALVGSSGAQSGNEGGVGVSLEALNKLSMRLRAVARAAIPSFGKGSSPASSPHSAETLADQSVLEKSGWDTDAIGLLATITTALHRLWLWSLRPLEPSILGAFSVNDFDMADNVRATAQPKAPGRLRQNLSSALVAAGLDDAPSFLACMLSMLLVCNEDIYLSGAAGDRAAAIVKAISAPASDGAPDEAEGSYKSGDVSGPAHAPAQPSQSSSPAATSRLSSTVAALALSSRCQAGLYKAFVEAPVESHFRAQEAAAAASSSLAKALATVTANSLGGSAKPQLVAEVVKSVTGRGAGALEAEDLIHRGQVWAGRLDGGRGSGYRGLDVISLLTEVSAPLWMHDVGPVAELLGNVAVKQFRHHKDAMLVFLELVVAGQKDKLLQLARADRNVTGNQLRALLSHDLSGDRGRQVMKKNAFALMRMQRYRHAAAAFLCAEPPLLKEACGVLALQMADPMCALLVARLVEQRLGVERWRNAEASGKASVGAGNGASKGSSVHSSGLVLGPVARGVLVDHIIPGLQRAENEGGYGATAGSGAEGLGLKAGTDRRTALLLAFAWLQDRSQFRYSLAEHINDGLFLAPSDEGDACGGAGAGGYGGQGGGNGATRAMNSSAPARSVPRVINPGESVSRWRGELVTAATAGGGASGNGVGGVDSAAAAAATASMLDAVPLPQRRSAAARLERAHSLLTAPAALAWICSRRPALLPPGGVTETALALARLMGSVECGGGRDSWLQALLLLQRPQREEGPGKRWSCAFDSHCRESLDRWRRCRAVEERLLAEGAAGCSAPAVTSLQGLKPDNADEDDADLRRALEALQKTRQLTREQAAGGGGTDTQQASTQPPVARKGFNLAFEPVQKLSRPLGAALVPPANALDAFMTVPAPARPKE